MDCEPTTMPPPEAVDIPALRVRYRHERERRLRREGQAHYVRPTDEGIAGIEDYAADPHMPVAPRDAVVEELEVLVFPVFFGPPVVRQNLELP